MNNVLLGLVNIYIYSVLLGIIRAGTTHCRNIVRQVGSVRTLLLFYYNIHYFKSGPVELWSVLGITALLCSAEMSC
jgi:hypothetical protein